jgi:hypothetical protein
MGYGDNAHAAEKLYGEFLKRTAEASEVIRRLVRAVGA